MSTNLLTDSSFLYIYSTYGSNVKLDGTQFSYSTDFNTSSDSGRPLTFSLLRYDGSDSSVKCMFAQYYKVSYSQTISANYQTLGGNTFVDNFNSTFGYELPYGSNNQYLCATVDSSSNVITGFKWTSFSNTAWGGINGATSLFSYSPADVGGDSPSVDSPDYSQISNAIYSVGAVIIVVCFFSLFYKMFIRLKG